MTKTIRVLVVDDKQSAADMLALFFKLEGYLVTTAYDGEEAVAAAARETFDLILMDLAMPRLDGYSAARRISEQGGSPAPILVALTGWSQDEVTAKAMESGFIRHLVKPVAPDALRSLLADLDLAPE